MSVLFVGVGNEFRSDDSLGYYLIKQLEKILWGQGFEFALASGEGSALMDLWSEREHVVVFDALMSQGSPGRLVELNANEDYFPSDLFKYSSHAFSLAEAVELSRVLGRLPKMLQVFAIEGQNFGYGQIISEPVLRSCEELLDSLEAVFGEAKVNTCRNS